MVEPSVLRYSRSAALVRCGLCVVLFALQAHWLCG
jgi:hypothetical protein